MPEPNESKANFLSRTACRMLFRLAELNLEMGSRQAGPPDPALVDEEQGLITELLEALLDRPPTDEEIQAATAP